MKQKIVINVTMQSEKKKSKVMQIVVEVQGVTSVTIEKENDKITVIGEGIDVACLVKSLRKKFCNVELVSVEEVKPPPPPPPKCPTKCPITCPPPSCQPCPPKSCSPCQPPPCQPCPPTLCTPCSPPPCYNRSPCQAYSGCQDYDFSPPSCLSM